MSLGGALSSWLLGLKRASSWQLLGSCCRAPGCGTVGARLRLQTTCPQSCATAPAPSDLSVLLPLGVIATPAPLVQVRQQRALSVLLPIFTSKRYLKALGADAPSVLGAGLEELFRFVPVLRSEGVDTLVALLRALCIIGGVAHGGRWQGVHIDCEVLVCVREGQRVEEGMLRLALGQEGTEHAALNLTLQHAGGSC